ncbi:MAG: O-antigen ligase family protein [Chloroflexota bacterium]|nr:O-antigen ligase family protein [Chloroflexota bacterium]
MLSTLSKNTVYRVAVSVLWFLVIIGLPITSFPLLSSLTGAIVAPFSAIPLALLMLIWLIPYLIDHGKFPVEIMPYLYFVIFALIITGLAFFLNGAYLRDRNFFGQSFRAFVTVGIGLCFYLIFSAFPQNEERIRQTLMFITIMGAILIPWTLFEVNLLRKYSLVQGFPAWVNKFRSLLAVQSPNTIFTNRVMGFAYEPSWFVRIFNLVLFPIWLAAVYQRETLFKFRLWIFQMEDLLMVCGLIVFGYSSPRIGLVAFLASVAFLGLSILNRIIKWVTNWYLKHLKHPPKHIGLLKVILVLVLVTILFGLAAGALQAYISAASSWDNRFELLLQYADLDNSDIFPLTETKLVYLARRLAFFERMIYWFGGWHIFADYPFGVGLGNAGFYFSDRMRSTGLDSYELRNLVYRANYLANTKNMWIRLLAETGFIGLALFLVWLFLLWRSAGLIRKSSSKTLRILGLAGQLFLLAYLFESFSMDSFAMPYQWVMTGLISAGGVLVRRELASKDMQPVSA